MASHDLISLQVALEPLQPARTGHSPPPPVLLGCVGDGVTEKCSDLACSQSYTAEGCPGEDSVQSPSDYSAPWCTQAQPGGGLGLWVKDHLQALQRERGKSQGTEVRAQCLALRGNGESI